jgi:hypothetical protein
VAKTTPEEWIHWFREAMVYQLGVRYSPDWKKDVDKVREMLLDFGEDMLRRMARKLIEDPDEFSKAKTGISIQRLYVRRNHLAQSLHIPVTSETSPHGSLTPEQVKWRVRYVEHVLESPSLDASISPVKEEWLNLHAYYSRLLLPAEKRAIARGQVWGPARKGDPSEVMEQQMSDPGQQEQRMRVLPPVEDQQSLSYQESSPE